VSFVSQYRINGNIINANLSNLRQHPELLCEVLLFSNIPINEFLPFLRGLQSSTENKRAYIRINHLVRAAEAALLLGFPYIDIFEVKPEISLLDQTVVSPTFGPHIGISFGHPAFVIEAAQTQSLLEATKSALIGRRLRPADAKISVIYHPEISASSPIDLGNNFLSAFVKSTSKRSILLPSQYNNLYLGDTYYRYLNLSNLDRLGVPTLISKRPQKHFFNPDKTSCSLENLVNCDASIQHFYTSSATPKIKEIVMRGVPIVAIHTRDAAFSGNSQHFRDSDFTSYIPLVEFLIQKGFFVVRLSRVSISCPIDNSKYLDLSIGQYTLADQLLIFSKSTFVIGTGSGISHWSILSNTSIVYANCVALPCSGIAERHLYAPKALTTIPLNLTSHDRENLLIRMLSSSWNEELVSNLGIRSLTPNELIDDVSYLMDLMNDSREATYTAHGLLRSLSYQLSSVSDFILTSRAFYNLRSAFSC
jgi:putative glycosyltransferase (TIGR04372 family)